MLVIRTLLIFMIIAGGSSLEAGSSSTPVALTCPVTTPTDHRPEASADPFKEDAALHHEDGIWVSIPVDGIIRLAPDDSITFGPLDGWRSSKVTWLREEGVEGFIEVTGHRLDEKSDLTPQTPLSPQRQYVRVGQVSTGLAFPSEGCWEVTGFVGDREITFVVDVRFANADATPVS